MRMMKAGFVLIAAALLIVACIGVQKPTTKAKVGSPAPEIALASVLQAPEGTKATLESLRGKVVVLKFWATWCGPCVASIPNYNELVEKFKDRPVQFIAISDESRDIVEKFLNKRPIKGWVGLDKESSSFRAYGVRAIPFEVVIDQKGTVVLDSFTQRLTPEVLDGLLGGQQASAPEATGKMSAEPAVDFGKKEEGPGPLFQVVVRPSSAQYPSSTSQDMSLRLIGMPPDFLLRYAFAVPTASRMLVKAGLPEGKFDVFVTLPQSQQHLRQPLLQQAVAAAFDVVAKREKRAMNVYILTLAAGGKHRLTPTAMVSGGSMTSSGSERDGKSHFKFINADAKTIAQQLESSLDRPIVDETRLEGRFDGEIAWTRDDPKSVLEALKDTVGLELKEGKREMDVLVVEKGSPGKAAQGAQSARKAEQPRSKDPV